jgi:hypothetical protein
MIALKRMNAKAQGYQQELDTIIQEVAYLEMKKKEEIKRQQGISLLLKVRKLQRIEWNVVSDITKIL